MKCKCLKCGYELEASWDIEEIKEIIDCTVNCPNCGEYKGIVYDNGQIAPKDVGNPRILIASDGERTVLYVNGKKVERATECDFSFHADMQSVDLTYKNYKLKADGSHEITNNGTELVTETHTWHR